MAGSGLGPVNTDERGVQFMNSKLLEAACLVIPNKQMLVNVVSRRVRQLSQGHRPLVACAPGTGLADVALTEISENKLGYESTLGLPKEESAPPAKVVAFRDTPSSKKKAA